LTIVGGALARIVCRSLLESRATDGHADVTIATAAKGARHEMEVVYTQSPGDNSEFPVAAARTSEITADERRNQLGHVVLAGPDAESTIACPDLDALAAAATTISDVGYLRPVAI
jgi:hypothetical protein